MTNVVKGSLKEVIAFRLRPGADVMKSIQEICEREQIKNGIIMSAIGSLNGAVYCNPIPKEEIKIGYGYGTALRLYGPIELVSATGMICHGDDGTVQLHVHCALSDQNGNAYGGHMLEGNHVLITTDVVIGVLDGIDMGRRVDDEIGMPVLHLGQC